jgi:hypothetical protein
VKRAIGDLLAELRALLREVLECRIVGQALLGAEAVELRVAGVGEAVALQGCVGGGLLLELGEGVGGCGALWAAEEGHCEDLILGVAVSVGVAMC